MDDLLIEPEPTERELGTAPIKPLFARYAAITFAGMLAQMVMVVLRASSSATAWGRSAWPPSPSSFRWSC